MFQRCVQFTCRLAGVAVIFIALGAVGGCAMWDRDRWDLSRYRDERAIDINHRLERTEPIVQNPF